MALFLHPNFLLSKDKPLRRLSRVITVTLGSSQRLTTNKPALNIRTQTRTEDPKHYIGNHARVRKIVQLKIGGWSTPKTTASSRGKPKMGKGNGNFLNAADIRTLLNENIDENASHFMYASLSKTLHHPNNPLLNYLQLSNHPRHHPRPLPSPPLPPRAQIRRLRRNNLVAPLRMHRRNGLRFQRAGYWTEW